MPERIVWLTPPPNITLTNSEVHLWKAELDANVHNAPPFFGVLNNDEQKRALQFKFEKDRNRFIAARGILRRILSRYLDCSPAQLQFVYNANGKPSLRNEPNLRFNLSHSEGLALFAFSRGHELGVDVEWQRIESIDRQIVGNSFSEREQVEFNALTPPLRAPAFFFGWTRKEAYLKARGESLRANLKDIEVFLYPQESARLIKADPLPWKLFSFVPKPGFAAALVIEDSELKFRHWEWREQD